MRKGDTQRDRIFDLMSDGHWRTLPEIRRRVHGLDTGLSARLRDLRKPAFGGYKVDRRQRGNKKNLYEYRVVINDR